MEQSRLNVLITAQNQATAELQKATNSLGSFKSSLGSAMTVAKGFVLGEIFTAAAENVKDFVTDSVKAFEAQQNALTQMDTVLKSTHGAAGLFKQDLVEQAEALENLTPYSHVAIEGVENLLLTFTEVHGAIYQQAIPAILDVATAMHEDLQSAAVQVGKALNDPATGMSMLHRIGVTFTKEQIDQAKAMEGVGNMAGAQAIVLKELQKEFGGSAEAAGGTFAGSMEKLKNKLDEAKEKFGEALVKGVQPFAKALADFVASDGFSKWVDGAAGFVEKLNEKFFEFLKSIAPLVQKAMKDVGSMVNDWVVPAIAFLKKSIEDLIHKYPEVAKIAGIVALIGAAFMASPVLTTIALMVAGLALLHAHWSQVQKIFQDGLKAMEKAIQPILPLLILMGIQVMNYVIRPLGELWQVIMTQLWPALQNLWNVLSPLLIPVLEAMGAIVGGILVFSFEAFVIGLHVVIAVLSSVISVISGVINFVSFLVAAITGQWGRIPGIIGSFFGNIFSIITSPFRIAFNAVAGFWNDTVGRLSWKVPDWVPGIGGKTIGAPKLPMLADGGIVDSPTLALIGEAGPEAVVPLNKKGLDNFGVSGNNGSGNMEFHLHVGVYAGMPSEKRKIAVDFWNEIVREARAHNVQLPQIGASGVQ